jgi:hypothetical protein
MILTSPCYSIILNEELPFQFLKTSYAVNKPELKTCDLIWRHIPEDEKNFDNRIFEMSIMGDLFVNSVQESAIDMQLFLNYRTVVIYYKDKPPAIGPEIYTQFDTKLVKNLSPEELLQTVEENMEGFNYFNQLPLYKLNENDSQKNNSITNFNERIREVMDFGKYENQLVKFPIDLSDDQLKSFIIDMLTTITNFYYTGDIEVLNGTQEDREENGLDSIASAVDDWVKSKVEEIMAYSPSKQFFIQYAKAMSYYTHRSMRQFYFGNSSKMLTQLFKGFIEGTSTFESLIPNLYNLDDYEHDDDVINQYTVDRFFYDLIFDDLTILQLPMMTKESVQLRKYKNKRRDDVLNAFLNIFNTFKKDINQFVLTLNSPHEPIGTFDISDDTLNNMLLKFNKVNKEIVYKMYADLFKESINQIKFLSKIGISDINEASPEQLDSFRKSLTIMGYVLFNPEDNPYELGYIESDFFSNEMRRLRLI